jgi:predicted metal-dependent HD superfamily phosphohydrolase
MLEEVDFFSNKWYSLWRNSISEENRENLGIIFAKLVDRYTESHRHYHTLQHLEECLTNFEKVRTIAEHPEEVELALWFHDAIYDPQRGDNEIESAKWVLEVAIACHLGVADRIFDLVMATRHDRIPLGIDAQILVDVDLAILGSDRTRFWEYEGQVRREYAWVDDRDFYPQRQRILQSFLDREQIYHTQYFRDDRELSARIDLLASLENCRRYCNIETK